jgi:NTE family protein
MARCTCPLALLSEAESLKYGSTGNWNCRDLKFFVGRINFEQLGAQRSPQLNSIPTRFNLSKAEVQSLITAGQDAVRTNQTFQAFLASIHAGAPRTASSTLH